MYFQWFGCYFLDSINFAYSDIVIIGLKLNIRNMSTVKTHFTFTKGLSIIYKRCLKLKLELTAPDKKEIIYIIHIFLKQIINLSNVYNNYIYICIKHKNI